MRTVIVALLVGLMLSFASLAEQKMTLGNWDVHYIAFPSPLLTPEVAKQYRLQRSKYNGIVNISVLNSASQQAEKVAISGSAKDLQGRVRQLEFTEVVEGDAVYYLAQVPFHHEQRYSFSINLQQGNAQQQLNFVQTFYVD